MIFANFEARAKAYVIDHFVLFIPVGFVAAIFSQNIIDTLGLNIDYSGGMGILVPLVAMVYSAVPILGLLDTLNNLVGSHTLHVAMFAQSLSIIISIILIEA